MLREQGLSRMGHAVPVCPSRFTTADSTRGFQIASTCRTQFNSTYERCQHVLNQFRWSCTDPHACCVPERGGRRSSGTLRYINTTRRLRWFNVTDRVSEPAGVRITLQHTSGICYEGYGTNQPESGLHSSLSHAHEPTRGTRLDEAHPVPHQILCGLASGVEYS